MPSVKKSLSSTQTLPISNARSSQEQTDQINADWISNNTRSTAHAVIMMVGLSSLAAGLFWLQIGLPVWHGWNQLGSVLIMTLGACLGFSISPMVERVCLLLSLCSSEQAGILMITQSDTFKSSHQMTGLAVSVALAVNLVFGFCHHRIYRNESRSSRIAPFHKGVGILILLAGIVNCYL